MTRRRGLKLAVTGLILLLLGIGGWQLSRWAGGTSAGAGSAGTGLTLYPGDQGIPAPDIEGRSINGEQLSLHRLTGHAVVLNVWGSWCAPCRAEAPDLARISKQTAAQGVRFVGIDVRDNPSAARAFEAHFGIAYPSFDDQSGLVLAQFAGIVPVSAVPSTLVIDRSGLIRARLVGRIDPTTLRGLIQDARVGR